MYQFFQIIQLVKTYDNEVWQSQNLTELNSLGAEIQAKVNLREQFGKSFPNHIQLSYIYNTIEKEEIKSDIKDLESYLTEVTDHHKKELLHEIIAYIEKKV